MIIYGSKFDKTNSYFNDNLYICLCYNVPQGATRQGFMDNDIFDRIILQIEQIKTSTEGHCSFIICGDLNARIGELNDFVADDAVRHIDALPEFLCC